MVLIEPGNPPPVANYYLRPFGCSVRVVPVIYSYGNDHRASVMCLTTTPSTPSPPRDGRVSLLYLYFPPLEGELLSADDVGLLLIGWGGRARVWKLLVRGENGPDLAGG